MSYRVFSSFATFEEFQVKCKRKPLDWYIFSYSPMMGWLTPKQNVLCSLETGHPIINVGTPPTWV